MGTAYMFLKVPLTLEECCLPFSLGVAAKGEQSIHLHFQYQSRPSMHLSIHEGYAVSRGGRGWAPDIGRKRLLHSVWMIQIVAGVSHCTQVSHVYKRSSVFRVCNGYAT